MWQAPKHHRHRRPIGDLVSRCTSLCPRLLCGRCSRRDWKPKEKIETSSSIWWTYRTNLEFKFQHQRFQQPRFAVLKYPDLFQCVHVHPDGNFCLQFIRQGRQHSFLIQRPTLRPCVGKPSDHLSPGESINNEKENNLICIINSTHNHTNKQTKRKMGGGGMRNDVPEGCAMYATPINKKRCMCRTIIKNTYSSVSSCAIL